MKVRKYLLICIAAIALNALTACGGESTQSDPLDPENPENPEPPAYFNPIEGEWTIDSNDEVKDIFTQDFRWQRSYLINGSWDEPDVLRSYKMIDGESFIANGFVYKFSIKKDNDKEILTIIFPGGEGSYHRLK